MALIRRAGFGAVLVLLAAAAVSAPATASGASATTTQVPYEVTFDSTMVNQFAGLGGEPEGSETTQIQATIPITASGSGPYTGSAAATYTQATGTITETCVSGGTTGTTEEIEQSGTPTTFMATYTPGANNTAGTLGLNLGALVGGLEETFQDIPGCGGLTTGNTTPRFIADFYADHQSQFALNLSYAGDATFNFALLPGASLGGSSSYAGSYDFTGGATNNNLTYSETTAISVFAHAVSGGSGGGSGGAGGATTCKVPSVKGDKLAAAEKKIKSAGCAVGAVKRKKSAKKNRGRVLSQTVRAGLTKATGTKVGLTVGK
jgi:hypothetical protein